MTKEHLDQLIRTHYRNHKLFRKDFNDRGGDLNSTTLSRHINGHSPITGPSLSAYTFYFQLLELEKRKPADDNQLATIDRKLDTIIEIIQ